MFFLQGYTDSLRYEIAVSALIATIIAYLLKSQIEDLQGMKFFYYNDFLPLIRAYNGETDISIQEIRKGVIKALEILLDRIKSDDNNNKLTESCLTPRTSFYKKKITNNKLHVNNLEV